MHRFILGLERDDPRHGDHKSKCGLDNRKDNLRPADDTQSARNKNLRKDNKSGARCVYWNERRHKYDVFITVDYKSIYLGSFDRFEDAKAAYEKAAFEYFGEFASFD